MADPKYAAFRALDPFFNIVQQGLTGLVDGDHYCYEFSGEGSRG
jgi:hypothetical protein